MAFGSLTIGSATYNSIGTGVYQNSEVAFGQPDDLVKINGGRVSKTSKQLWETTTAAVSRHLEKDVTEGDTTSRRKASLNCQIVVPDGFTAAEIDSLASDIATLLTEAFLNRVLMGES